MQRTGLRSLWTGYSLTLMTSVPSSGVFWPVFERIKHTLHALGVPHWPGVTASSFLAGCCSGWVSSPFVMLRTRYQLALAPGRAGMLRQLREVAQAVLREHGWRAPWRGAASHSLGMGAFWGSLVTGYELLKVAATRSPERNTEGKSD